MAGRPFSAPLQFALRALRAEAREASAMHTRWVQVALVAVMSFLSAREFIFHAAPGLGMLTLLTNSVVAFQFLNLAYYASGFTEEREAGVGDLLLLSGGTRCGIWLGIATDRLVRPLVLLLVTLPLLMLCVALGGVAGADVAWSITLMVQATLFCHALGTLLSAVMPTTFAAGCAAYLTVLGFLLSIPAFELLRELFRGVFGFEAAGRFFRSASKVCEHMFEALFFTASWSASGPRAARFRSEFGAILTICLVLWAASATLFFLRPAGFFTGPGRRLRRKKLKRPPADAAVAWKQSRFAFPGRWFGWKYDLFLVAHLVVGWLWTISATNADSFGVWLALSMTILSTVRCMLEAWVLAWPEMKDGTWDALVALPGGLRAAMNAKFMAGLRHLPFELGAAVIGCGIFMAENSHTGQYVIPIALGALATAMLLCVATFYFSLVIPLIAPALAIVLAGFAPFVVDITNHGGTYHLYCGFASIVLGCAAWRRLSRDLPEG